MEITAQIASLEEEVNLLKNEIKTILQEIRSFVLDADNPFQPEGATPVFRPVERPSSKGEPPSEPEESAEGPGAPPTAEAELGDVPDPSDLPGTGPAAAPGMGPPPGSPPGPGAPPGLGRQPGSPEGPAGPPTAAAAPQDGPPPAYGDGSEKLSSKGGTEDDRKAPQAWSISTIANLVTWIDENCERLGQAHVHMILDLAAFAGFVPKDAQDTLLKVVKLAKGRKDAGPPSVNDLLVALRQLDTIFQEAEDDSLVHLRRRRRAVGSH